RLAFAAGTKAGVDLVLVRRPALVDNAQAHQHEIGAVDAQADGAEASLLTPHGDGVGIGAEARLLTAKLLPVRDRWRRRRRGRAWGRGPGALQTVHRDCRLPAVARTRAIDKLDTVDGPVAADKVEWPRAPARANELANADVLRRPAEVVDPNVKELDVVAGDL